MRGFFTESRNKIATLFFMLSISIMGFAGDFKIGDYQVKSSNSGNGLLGTNGIFGNLIGGLLSFLPLIQWVVLIGGIVMFGISVFNQFRGQQIDVAEIFKNLVIYAIVIGSVWFGPELFKNMFEGEAKKSSGANIVNEYIIETETVSNLDSLILE